MAIDRFEVTFRFTGGLADSGMLDGSDHTTSTQAVRRLLALHAHCSISGRVPRASLSEGVGYHVRHVASPKGSHADIWAIVFDPKTVGVASYFAGMYSSEIKLGINAGARFLRDSLRSALGTGPSHLPEFPRTEPVLSGLAENRAPLVDTDAEQDSERGRLREATVRILFDAARPIGRSADCLEIDIDGAVVATIDLETLRQLQNERQHYIDRQAALDHEITAALTPMRRTAWKRGELF
jgi:hypothetical protein